MQRRWATGAGGSCARLWSPPPPGLSKESGERRVVFYGCVVQTRQFLFGFSLSGMIFPE